MTEIKNTDGPAALPPPPHEKRKSRLSRPLVLGAALVAAGIVGAGAGTLAQRAHQPVLVALSPAPITAMKDWSQVAVKGQVAELFGNKFIVADDSGRALVETGRKGEGTNLVNKDETVTVQGRFEHGSIHAMAIQHADGRTVMLDPPGPPPPPPPRGPLS